PLATPLDILATLIPTWDKKPWQQGGITEVGQLYKGAKLRPFPDIQREYNLPSRLIFPYLQIKSCLSQNKPRANNANTREHLCEFELLCTHRKPLKKLISINYRLLLQTVDPPNDTHIQSWHSELGRTITRDKWDKAYSSHKGTTSCATHLELQRKLLYRWYLVPARVHHIWSQSTDKCWRCGHQRGTMTHVWWMCDNIQPFWYEVQNVISNIIRTQVTLTLELCILFIPPDETPKATWTAMYHVLISAATLIARFWKQVAIPSRELLIQQVSLNWVYETVFATQFGTKKHLKQAHTMWTDFLTRSKPQAAPKESPPTTTQDKTPRKPHTDQTPARTTPPTAQENTTSERPPPSTPPPPP
ncbi:Hypothetical predicted protein, partial [Pelobates cultripes]